MALLDFFRTMGGGLLGGQEQMMPAQGSGLFGGLTGGLSSINEKHPGLLMGAGRLIAGEDMSPAIMYGLGAKKEKAARSEQMRKENATKKWLMGKGIPEEEIDAAIAAGQIGNYFKKDDANDVTFGLNPIYGTDPETGETVLGTMGNNGTFKRIDTDGFKVASGVDKIDGGTKWLLYDKRTGQLVGEQPKENFQEAADTARGTQVGKGQGEAAVTYESMKSKMPGLERVIGSLDKLAEEATYTMGGQVLDAGRRQLGMAPRDAAIARTEYIAMVDNQVLPMLRDTFGAAFTVKEGETLRATLGDPDKSPQEKQAILRMFIEQKRRDIEALGQQSGMVQPQGDPTGGGVVDYKTYFGGQ